MPPPAPVAPAPPKPITDQLIDVAASLRGTFGGMFGPLAGAALDTAAALRHLRSAAAAPPPSRPIPAPPPLAQELPHAEPVPIGKALPPDTLPTPTPGMFEFSTETGKAAEPMAFPQVEPVQLPEAATAEPIAVGEVAPPPAIAPPAAAAPAGEAAAGGAGGIAAAAGPAAAAIAVAAAAQKLKDGMEDAIKGVGAFTAELLSADADVGQSLKTVGGGLEGFSDKIFLVQPALGFLAGAAGAATDALGSVTDALNAQAERYAQFSPEIAVSEAMADVRQTFGDLRRAREAGPDLAAFVNEQSKLQQQFEDEKIKLLRIIAPLATGAMQDLSLLVSIISPFTEAAAQAFELTLASLNKILGFLHLQLPKLEPKDDDPFDSIPTLDVLGARPFADRGEGSQSSPV